MNYRLYLRLKADAEAEYRRKLEAIETVWKLSGGTSPTPSRNGSKSDDSGLVRGDLQEAVRRAYKQMSADFTLRDIYNQLVATEPELAAKIKDKLPSMSGTLKRMADDKELVLVEAGSGKRPSKYRRPG